MIEITKKISNGCIFARHTSKSSSLWQITNSSSPSAHPFVHPYSSCPQELHHTFLFRNGSLCVHTHGIMYLSWSNIHKTKMQTSAHIKWIACPQSVIGSWFLFFRWHITLYIDSVITSKNVNHKSAWLAKWQTGLEKQV